MRLLTVLPVLLLFVTPALSQNKLSDVKKANDLFAACQAAAPEVQRAYLSGFVTGTADASVGKHLCPKEPVSSQQLVDVFCKYLETHPKNRNRPGGLLLGLALSEAWPCSGTK